MTWDNPFSYALLTPVISEGEDKDPSAERPVMEFRGEQHHRSRVYHHGSYARCASQFCLEQYDSIAAHRVHTVSGQALSATVEAEICELRLAVSK